MRCLRGALLLLAVFSCQKPCPEIGCVPTISIAYDAPINSPYHIEVKVLGNSYSAECPKDRTSPVESLISCNSSGFVVQGSELFLGSNPPGHVTVTISTLATSAGNIVSPVDLDAEVTGTVNGDGCEMNCFRAAGTLALSSP